jgi:hypothetical protein
MDFYRIGRREKDFELGVEMVLARLLASPQFIYRIEEEPAGLAPGQAFRYHRHRFSASRLSFFLWSSPPTRTLLGPSRGRGRLKGSVVLEQQVRRMIRASKVEGAH